MVLYGLEDEAELASHEEASPDVPSRGVALPKRDVEELQNLVERGTPETVIRRQAG